MCTGVCFDLRCLGEWQILTVETWLGEIQYVCMYQLIYGFVAKFDFVVKVSFSLLIYVEKPV